MKFKKSDKVLLISAKGARYVVDIDQTFYTKDGELKLKSLIGKKYGTQIKSGKGLVHWALPPNFADLLGKAARGPQAVLLKDAGLIATYSGIGPGSKVLDAGTGSGWLAAFLAHFVAPAEVVSYEINTEFISLAKKNMDFLGVKNVKIKTGDIYEKVPERNMDLVTLDIVEPWRVRDLTKVLKPGGIVAAYLPQMTQVIRFVNFCKLQDLEVEKVIEIIERPWKVWGNIARPESQMLGHTAFLVFARRLG